MRYSRFLLSRFKTFTISILLRLKQYFKSEYLYNKFQIFFKYQRAKGACHLRTQHSQFYSRGTEDSSISLRQTGFFLLKFWTFLFTSNWKLPDGPCPYTSASGGCDIMACFWTWAPFQPFRHLALFSDHTGLESHGQFLLLAKAVTKQLVSFTSDSYTVGNFVFNTSE